MEEFSYKLEVFEGPLDLLLSLITKNKLNIYDIPIATLVNQYLEHIELMRIYDMEVTSDFIDMATRLIHMKSVALLPQSEEAEELKKELTGKLIEYQQCKAVAELLSQKFTNDYIIRDALEISVDYTYTRNHDKVELLKALQNINIKKTKITTEAENKVTKLISTKFISVASQVVFVLKSIIKNKRLSLKRLFSMKTNRSEKVAAFMAVLELIKNKKIVADSDDILTVNREDKTA